MLKKLVVSIIAMLFVASFLLAHGEPILGTITAVNKDSITIQDTKGKTVEIMFDKTTKFLKDKKATTSSDLKVGVRVVIDAHMDPKMKMYSAEEIQIGATAAPKPR